MTYSISITEDGACTAVRAFLSQAFGCEVVRGLDNRVPMPLGGFINITPVMQQRLATNTVVGVPATLPADESQTITQPTMLGIQIDFYGPTSGDWSAIFATLWRDTTTCDFLAAQAGKIQPLHNSEPLQMALISGESQYVERWIVKAFLQYNGTVTLDQQFFKGVTVELIDVDAIFH